MKILLNSLIFLIFFDLELNAQRGINDSLLVTVSMPRNDIFKPDDLVLNIKITSQKKGIIEVPVQDVFGYVQDHSGFIAMQTQNKIEGKYTDLPLRTRIDNIPGVNIDTLRTNDSKVWTYGISGIWKFNKGDYRIRVLARLSILNQATDVYSDWYYFSCKDDIKRW
jgi:hypothetical protein